MSRDALPVGRYAEPALLILVSLAGGAQHGYAIMEDIRTFARTEVGPGTLYGALSRLETANLIAPVASDDRRRPYTLTALGIATLRTHLQTLAVIAGTGLERLETA